MDNLLFLPHNEQSTVKVFKKIELPYLKVSKENITLFKNNNEKLIKQNSSVFDDNELSQLTIIIDNNHENSKFIVSNVSNPIEKSEMRFTFLKKMLMKKIIFAIKLLRTTLNKVKLINIVMRNRNENTLPSDIKSICWVTNIERNNSVNDYPIQSESNENIGKISFNENRVVHLHRNTVRDKMVVKFLEMFLSSMFILFLELQPKRMSYVFDFYSRFICIFGFCGTLILLSNHIKVTNIESDKKLFNWDLIFCLFMFFSYVWLTFAIIFMYHFYITYPLSSLVIFGFLMQLIFFLDIKINLICKKNSN